MVEGICLEKEDILDDMDKRVSLLEEAFERHEERISAHGREIDTLRMNREHDSVVLAQVNSTCLDIKQRIDAMEKKPAMRWESMTSAIVNAIALAVLAYVLAQVGL